MDGKPDHGTLWTSSAYPLVTPSREVYCGLSSLFADLTASQPGVFLWYVISFSPSLFALIHTHSMIDPLAAVSVRYSAKQYAVAWKGLYTHTVYILGLLRPRRLKFRHSGNLVFFNMWPSPGDFKSTRTLHKRSRSTRSLAISGALIESRPLLHRMWTDTKVLFEHGAIGHSS